MIYSIGHSSHPIVRFVALLQRHRIATLADVRSTPFSRFHPQFNRTALQVSLAAADIEYVFLGEELGARPREPEYYEQGRVSYRKLAASERFRQGLERLQALKPPAAMMCAEKEPLECHRTLLVARELEKLGITVTHIRSDGTLETQHAAGERLLAGQRRPATDLFKTPQELLEEAFEAQAQRRAYSR